MNTSTKLRINNKISSNNQILRQNQEQNLTNHYQHQKSWHQMKFTKI